MKLNAPIGNSQALAASLLLLGAVFVAACSLGFEHIGGFIPCKLCYVQRHCHYAMLPLSALTLFVIWRGWPALMTRTLFVVMAAIMIYSAGIGIYQAGSEWDFWYGPNDCTSSLEIPSDVTNIFEQLNQTKLVSCTEAQLRILGLSFAGWNVLLSFGLLVIAFCGALLSKNQINPLIKMLPFLKDWLARLTPHLNEA